MVQHARYLGQTSFTHTNTQPFYGPFSGATRVSWCQKKSSSGLLWCKGRQQADTPTIRICATPYGLISGPPPSLHFYAGCSSCHNLPTLYWLGTDTEYAGLHTQWRGSRHHLVQMYCPDTQTHTPTGSLARPGPPMWSVKTSSYMTDKI